MDKSNTASQEQQKVSTPPRTPPQDNAAQKQAPQSGVGVGKDEALPVIKEAVTDDELLVDEEIAKATLSSRKVDNVDDVAAMQDQLHEIGLEEKLLEELLME